MQAGALRHAERQGRLRCEGILQGIRSGLHSPEQRPQVLVDRIIEAHLDRALEARSVPPGRHRERRELGRAGIGPEHGAIAFEDIEHHVEHVIHHLREVVGALQGAVHAFHALQVPQVHPMLLLGGLTIRDIPYLGEYEGAISVLEQRHPDFDGELGAILAPVPRFEGEGLPAKEPLVRAAAGTSRPA